MSAISPDDNDMSFKLDILTPQEMNDYIRSNITIERKQPSKFLPVSMLPTFLKEILGMKEDFLDQLQDMGCTTPTSIINSFGRDPKAIAIF